MAFTTSNPVTVGEPTKKTDYDAVFDNTQENRYRTMIAGAGGIAAYDVVYLSAADTVLKAKADSASTMPAIGIAPAAIAAAAQGSIQFHGTITNGSWAWTAGQLLYVSAATAGALTATKPTGTNIVQPAAIALTATTILSLFNDTYQFATGSIEGHLAAADWTTFNNKASLPTAGSFAFSVKDAGSGSTAERSGHRHFPYPLDFLGIPFAVLPTARVRVAGNAGYTVPANTTAVLLKSRPDGGANKYYIAGIPVSQTIYQNLADRLEMPLFVAAGQSVGRDLTNDFSILYVYEFANLSGIVAVTKDIVNGATINPYTIPANTIFIGHIAYAVTTGAGEPINLTLGGNSIYYNDTVQTAKGPVRSGWLIFDAGDVLGAQDLGLFGAGDWLVLNGIEINKNTLGIT